MAAVLETAGSRIETVFGNKRIVFADLTSVDNAETWDSLLTTVEFAVFFPTTNVANGLTVSGGVVTFANGSALAGKIMAVGI
jgi:hypothetical protein